MAKITFSDLSIWLKILVVFGWFTIAINLSFFIIGMLTILLGL